MGIVRRLVPHHEVIVCRPSESFRWNVHDYPHHLAKWHHHPEYELHLIQSSSGTMMVGDHVGPFSAGCLVLTGPDVPHNWVSDIPPGTVVPERDMLVQFSADFADRILGDFAELEDVRTLLAEAAYGLVFTGQTARRGARLLQEIGQARGPSRMVLFLDLLATLAADPTERSTLSRRTPAFPASQVEERIEIALAYIAKNYASEIRLGTVADLCGMEPSAFSRWFKKQTGHTFAKFINRTRVYSACTRLTQTDQPITDICFEVGFNNIANFNRQFVKFCDQTPSAYRRSARRIASSAIAPSGAVHGPA
ncbi:AraC family transcriptional regulator [Chthonobacter rhizosphaerae]|uniref:AraC family transcriptional regulator n=1 Tax=Chthonobacter rhizosphaerae TaxID=2735553 RepID=UPI0015EFA492|nr:AraC family transcriptional regulator [Chthonobacter rhizosphaerae]